MKNLQRKCLKIQTVIIPHASDDKFAMNLFVLYIENYRLMNGELKKIRLKRKKLFRDVLNNVERLEESVKVMKKELPLFPNEKEADEEFFAVLKSYETQIAKLKNSFLSPGKCLMLQNYPRTPSRRLLGYNISYRGKKKKEFAVEENWHQSQKIFLENTLNQLVLILRQHETKNIPKTLLRSLNLIFPKNKNEHFFVVNEESLKKRISNFLKKHKLDLLDSQTALNDKNLFNEIEKIENHIRCYGWE